jgi:addiction module HigA family antidote
MKSHLNILKGLHPGLFLDKTIKEKGIKKGQLALDCREYPQTLTAITKGRRDMNTELSLKLENALGLEEGFLMTLQVFYDIKEAKKKQRIDHPGIRKVVFWDIDMNDLNWKDQYSFIINRVFERGNETEKMAINNYYGQALVKEVLDKKLLLLKKKKS